jgi:hypothetical protein
MFLNVLEVFAGGFAGTVAAKMSDRKDILPFSLRFRGRFMREK